MPCEHNNLQFNNNEVVVSCFNFVTVDGRIKITTFRCLDLLRSAVILINVGDGQCSLH